MQAEVEALTRALDDPERPLVALVGGAKVSTKLELLGNLIARVDLLVLGGGMANTFLFAQGTPVGKSLAEKEMADTARAIAAKARERNCQLVLPIDGRIARRFEAGAPSEVVAIGQVPEDGMILDIGPGSVRGDPSSTSRTAARWSGTARSARSRSRPSMPGRRRSPAGSPS